MRGIEVEKDITALTKITECRAKSEYGNDANYY
jgi:hypothetical protein